MSEYVQIAWFLAIVWALFYARRQLATHTVTISKLTDQEETVVFNTNFYSYEGHQTRERKMNRLFKLAEDRRTFCNHRMLDAIQKAQAEKGLQAVK